MVGSTRFWSFKPVLEVTTPRLNMSFPLFPGDPSDSGSSMGVVFVAGIFTGAVLSGDIWVGVFGD